MAPAIALVLIGLLGPLTAIQWREGKWLGAARWISRRLSPQLVAGVPMAGVLVATIGLSIVWPPGIILVFLAAGGFLWAVFAVASSGGDGDEPRTRRAPPARLSRPRPGPRRPGPRPDTRSAPETPQGQVPPPRRSP
jgi:hypothetical protein